MAFAGGQNPAHPYFFARERTVYTATRIIGFERQLRVIAVVVEAEEWGSLRKCRVHIPVELVKLLAEAEMDQQQSPTLQGSGSNPERESAK